MPRALFALLALPLVACSLPSSSEDDASPSTERPAGCERNICDVEYEDCEASSTSACDECTATCSGIDYSVLVSCLEACNRICSSPSTNTCATSRTSCQATRENAICADGMAPADLPGMPEWFYSYREPAQPHQGVCSADDVRGFLDACFLEGSTNAACTSFRQKRSACMGCMLTTDAFAAAWGPIVLAESAPPWFNTEGCFAAVTGDSSCARKVYEANACRTRCNKAADREACLAFAEEHYCKQALASAKACTAEIDTTSASETCGPPFESGSVDQLVNMLSFFCGE